MSRPSSPSAPATPICSFSANPTELNSDLFSGQIEAQQLVLQNSGGAPLTYNIATDLGVEVISYPDQELAKGEEDPGPGVLGSGGPDPFGYSWRDSDDPGGPVFNWIDITGTGTPVVLTDDSAINVALPFAFPFYGGVKNAVNISSNGFLGFGAAGNTVFTNGAIPSVATPNDACSRRWFSPTRCSCVPAKKAPAIIAPTTTKAKIAIASAMPRSSRRIAFMWLPQGAT